MNWFIFSLGIINMFGGGQYFIRGQWKLGMLAILYGLANFVFATLK